MAGFLALTNQMLVKKLVSGCKWISSIDVHPSGDHLIVGSYDRRVAWFDLDLSCTPYKTLKYHAKASLLHTAEASANVVRRAGARSNDTRD